MIDNYIQLNKDDRLKLEIFTDKGESTGEYLIFDLEDIDLPLKYQQLFNTVWFAVYRRRPSLGSMEAFQAA